MSNDNVVIYSDNFIIIIWYTVYYVGLSSEPFKP